MSRLDAEQRLLAHADAAAWGAADLADMLRQLDSWLDALHCSLDAGLALPPGLQPASALARQAAAVNQLLQDCRARWARQWAALQPAQMLADDFDSRLMLLVFGKFNAGKSSLCNFLAERFAAHGRAVRFFHLEAGRIVETGERLHEGATETTARLQGVCLGERLVLLDTPGLHSVTPENAALTQRFTDSADGVLWLTSSTSPGQVQALHDLARELRRSKPLLPVLTRSDVIEEDEMDGEIRKCLHNKTPANRALQEADVAARARDKLVLMGVDPRLLQAPVSISVHAARAQGQTAAALEDAGFARLYAALLDMLEPAQAYKQRKPVEVRLHHLQENVLGAIEAEVLPTIGSLQTALAQEQGRLQQLKPQMLRAAWREIAPELPALMEESAADLPALCAAVSRLAGDGMRGQMQAALADYALPGPPANDTAISLPTVAPDDHERLHAALQEALRERLDAAFTALLEQCGAALAPLAGQAQQLQQGLLQCAQPLQSLGRALRIQTECSA